MDHCCISSMPRSVIRLTVSFDTLAPYTSAKCAQISPVVKPRENVSTRGDTLRSQLSRLLGQATNALEGVVAVHPEGDAGSGPIPAMRHDHPRAGQ